MGNFSDYCHSCGNLKEDCTCSRGGGPWFTNGGKLTWEESEKLRKEHLIEIKKIKK